MVALRPELAVRLGGEELSPPAEETRSPSDLLSAELDNFARDRIYEAALLPELWPGVLDQLTIVGGGGGALSPPAAYGLQTDVFVVKLSPVGAYIWARRAGGPMRWRLSRQRTRTTTRWQTGR